MNSKGIIKSPGSFWEQVIQTGVELKVECPIKWASELIHATPKKGEPVLSQRYLRRRLGIFWGLLQRNENCERKFFYFDEELEADLPLVYFGIHQTFPIINLCVASLATILFKIELAKGILNEVDLLSYTWTNSWKPHLTGYCGYLKRADEWAVVELQTRCVKEKDKNKRFMTTIRHRRLEDSLREKFQKFCDIGRENRFFLATKRYFEGVLQMMLGFEEECFLQKFEEASQLQPENYFLEFIMRRHFFEIRRRSLYITDFVIGRKSVLTPSRKEICACKRAYDLNPKDPVVAFDHALLEKELFLGTAFELGTLELQDGGEGEDSTDADDGEEELRLKLKVPNLFRNVLRLVPRRSELAKFCHQQILSLFADRRLDHLPKTMLAQTFQECLRFWSEDQQILANIEVLILAGTGKDLVGSTFLRQMSINFPYFKKCAKVASQLKQFDWLINLLDSDKDKIEEHRPNQVGKFLFLKGLCYWFKGDNKAARTTWNDVTTPERKSLKKLNLQKLVRALCFECVVSYKTEKVCNAIMKTLKQIIDFGRIPHDNLGNIPVRASLNSVRFRIFKPARLTKIYLSNIAKNWSPGPDPCQILVSNRLIVCKSKMEVITCFRKLDSFQHSTFSDLCQVRVEVSKSVQPVTKGIFGSWTEPIKTSKISLLEHTINVSVILEIRRKPNFMMGAMFPGTWLVNTSFFATKVVPLPTFPVVPKISAVQQRSHREPKKNELKRKENKRKESKIKQKETSRVVRCGRTRKKNEVQQPTIDIRDVLHKLN